VVVGSVEVFVGWRGEFGEGSVDEDVGMVDTCLLRVSFVGWSYYLIGTCEGKND